MELLGKGQNGMDQWFNTMLADWPSFTTAVSPPRLVGPSIDVKELPDRFQVKVDVPGMEKKDLKVSVQGGELVIEGKREEEKKEGDAKKGYLRSERFFGSFCRVIALPAEVSEEGVKATYTNGVLALDLPKAKPAPAKGKTITID